MRIEATKQWARATRVIHGKRFERGRRRRSLTSVLLCLLASPGPYKSAIRKNIEPPSCFR
jgi:hypothetical protein